jgi:uncharacterized RDD family membrane protein YckC
VTHPGYPSHQQVPPPPYAGFGAPPGYHPAAVAAPAAPGGAPLAEFGTRLAARLIDGLILSGITLVLFVPIAVGLLLWAANASTEADVGPPWLYLVGLEAGLILLIYALQFGYEVELAKRGGQTYGKRIMKIRVAPLDPARPLTRGALARRWLVMGPGSLLPGVGLLDGLWQLWDQPYRQCLHDKFAGTVVVKVPV